MTVTEPEGKGKSYATKNPVMVHYDGPNNETIQLWTQDETMENTEKEHVQLKLNMLHISYIVTVKVDIEIMSTNLI